MTLMVAFQSMSSFLTPAVLFVLLNLVIATIFLSSRQHVRDHPSASFAAPLFPTTSPVLERLKSFTLHRFRSGEVPSDVNYPTNHTHSYTTSSLSTESRSNLTYGSSDRSLDEAFRAVVESSSNTTISNSDRAPPPPIAPTSSILDRIKSINLYQFRSGEIQTQQIQPERSQDEPSSSRLASMDANVVKLEKKKKKTKKTVNGVEGSELSIRRRREPDSATVVEEVDLHARADDFISKFKESLKIQRLNSILNYTEMLNRGR